MKKLVLLGLIAITLFTNCSKQTEAPIEKKIDWTKSSITIMNSLRPKLLTSWKIKEVHVTPFAPNTSEIGIFKDSILYNLGDLNINQINNSSAYETGNDVTGVIKFKTKYYPVGFRMLANPERIVKNTGGQVFALFEYRFPVGSHITEPEESYLSNLTLINSNFEIEVSEDGRVMIWKGLNRAIKSIRFEKY